jgi:hypothetical protein
LNIRRFLISFFLLFITSFIAISQSISVTGTIRDAHTQEPIAYASVYLLASGSGNLSDSSGYFSIRINNLTTDTLIVSFVGYEIFKLPVTGLNDLLPLDIQLIRGRANTGIVVRSSINKGLFLWKKIMTKKPLYNRYNLDNFGYEAYNKLEIDIRNFNADRVKNNIFLKPFSFIIKPLAEITETEGSLPAYLIESVSDYAHQRNPEKYYENIKASNTRGLINESISKMLGVMNQNVNIYNNYVNVMNKDFISPFHDKADNYYTFSVPDTQMVNGQKIFHFVFTPRHPGQNTFEGDAWVRAGNFEIQKISLYLGKDANINYIDRISVFQEFLPVNDSMIFLNRDKFFADFRVLGKKSLALTGRKSTSYRNILINSDSIKSFFNTQNIQEVIKTEPGFTQKTDSTWNRIRHDSLSKHEQAIYTTIDNFLRDPKYKKLQGNFKFLGSGYKDFGNLEAGKWFSLVSGNEWEGARFRLDLGTNKGFNKNIHLHSYLAYGTRDQKFKGQAEAFWIIQRKPDWFMLHFSYANDVDHSIMQNGKISSDNIFSLAIRKPNSTRKFLQTKNLQIDALKDWGKGFSTELFVSQQRNEPLQNLPPKEEFPVSTGEPLNNFELAIKLRFAYLEQYITGDFFRYSVGSKFPVIELLLAKGFPGILNSAYSYTKYSAAISDVLKISPVGVLTYKAYAGKINGTLPFTLLENHSGNDLYYYNSGAFNLMYRFEYISDAYAGVNIEHNIGSGLFRLIPVTRKFKWRQFWNVKTVWGSLSDKNKALNNTTSFFKTLDGKTYLEAGTGVDNIFKIVRIDLVWRVLPSPLPVKKVSRFGVFGSLQFKF